MMVLCHHTPQKLGEVTLPDFALTPVQNLGFLKGILKAACLNPIKKGTAFLQNA